MTAFSDDDFRRLKSFVDSPHLGIASQTFNPNSGVSQYTDKNGSRITLDIPQFEALLARLEAAEAYIASMPEDVTDDNCRLYKAWRKSAGK